MRFCSSSTLRSSSRRRLSCRSRSISTRWASSSSFSLSRTSFSRISSSLPRSRVISSFRSSEQCFSTESSTVLQNRTAELLRSPVPSLIKRYIRRSILIMTLLPATSRFLLTGLPLGSCLRLTVIQEETRHLPFCRGRLVLEQIYQFLFFHNRNANIKKCNNIMSSKCQTITRSSSLKQAEFAARDGGLKWGKQYKVPGRSLKFSDQVVVFSVQNYKQFNRQKETTETMMEPTEENCACLIF